LLTKAPAFSATAGNLLWVFAAEGYNRTTSVVSIEDTAGNVQYTHTAVISCPATTAGLVITLTMAGSDAGGGSDYLVFDVVNYGSFDKDQGCTGDDVTTGSHTFNGCDGTAATANGLVLSVIGVENDEVKAGTLGNYVACQITPLTSNSPCDENNGWKNYANPSSGATQDTWTTTSAAVGNWASWQVFLEAPATGGGGKAIIF